MYQDKFTNQIKQLELEKAKQKMGTFGGATAGTGFTNTASGSYGMTSGTAPSLTDSTAVGTAEIQKAKTEMNKPSMY